MDKKWNLQDIKPAQPKKRRSIDPSELRSLPTKEVISVENDGTVNIKIQNGKSKKKSHLMIALIVFFVIIGLIFGFSYLLSGADITVNPRNREPNVNAIFTAYKTPKVGELSYEILSIEAEGERQVTATGQEDVKTQSKGKITIHNLTDDTERLIKNTRFESPSGLIFKIQESVVIPAATKKNDELIPGTIQVEVFSDGTGEQYNLSPTKLTVPGFKEGGYDDLYKNVYAENNDAFTGGFDGPKFMIDEQELETEKQKLQTELRNTLLDRINSEKPAGFVVFDDATSVVYVSLPSVEYSNNLVTIKEKAILQIPIFKKEDFAKYIASATVPGYENDTVRIEDESKLTFTYESATTSSSDISSVDKLSFSLTGKPLIVWTFDESKLKTDMLGKTKTALPTILSSYPAIEKAEAVVRPFWKRNFPTKLDEITIVEEIQKN